MRASQATLVSYTITYDAIGQPIKTETSTVIPVTVYPITQREWTQAGQNGFNPDVKLSTPSVNYNGESEVTFEGKSYGVYRTYINGDITELYLERRGGL